MAGPEISGVASLCVALCRAPIELGGAPGVLRDTFSALVGGREPAAREGFARVAGALEQGDALRRIGRCSSAMEDQPAEIAAARGMPARAGVAEEGDGAGRVFLD
jgi:hypothetical protein